MSVSNKSVGFIEDDDGMVYAGKHLLIDVYGITEKPSLEIIEDTLAKACIATGATIVMKMAHPFSGGGSSGMIILAESHCSWHLWDEECFVAIDMFVCGCCDPEKVVPFVENMFKPTRMSVRLEKRGIH